MNTNEYEKLLNSVATGLYIYDAQSQTNEFINKEYTNLTGWSLDELNGMGEKFIELFHPDDQAKILLHMEQLMNAKESQKYEAEYRFKTKSGEWIWCFSQDTPYEFNEEGKTSKFIGSFLDVTERKKTEKALKESEETFRGAFKTSAIGMALVSLEGRWLEVNSSIPEMLGYTEEELLTKTFQDITHEDDLNTDLQYVQEMLDGKRETYSMEKRYYDKNGDIIWVLLSVSLAKTADNKPKYFVSQIENITERVKSKEALEQQLSEVQRLNEFMVNREEKMLQLKDEVNELRKELGKEPKYGK